MGIRLDWEIEADQQQVRQAGEDPQAARRRRRARLGVIAAVLLGLGVVGAVVGGIALRLRFVEEQAELLLQTAVEAEVTALRIGDESAFLAMQRSATDEWIIQQQQTFADYQALKIQRDVRLTGRVVDIVIDDMRGRAQVEEIIDGTPFVRTWFYWRYDDGWRHVPPDYTFWGESQTYDGSHAIVYYRGVDAPFARAVGAALDTWLEMGCTALGCATIPAVSVEIVPDESVQMSWSDVDPAILRMPSPYTGSARLDLPFDLNRQLQAADLLAERLVALMSPAQPEFPADAYYLRSAVVSWLVGRFTQINTNSFLVASLAERYGDQSVGALLRALGPNSDASVLADATGVALDAVGLDWRDFFTWRLTVEDELIRRGDETAFLNLYDTRDNDARLLAYARFGAGPTGVRRVVVSVLPEDSPAGGMQMRAVVQVGDGDTAQQEAVIFRISDDVWRRVN